MKRRSFLRGLLAAPAVVAVAPAIVEAVEPTRAGKVLAYDGTGAPVAVDQPLEYIACEFLEDPVDRAKLATVETIIEKGLLRAGADTAQIRWSCDYDPCRIARVLTGIAPAKRAPS